MKILAFHFDIEGSALCNLTAIEHEHDHPAELLAVGAATIRLKHEVAEFARLGVHESFRRTGIGTLLFQTALDEAHANGKPVMSWTVMKDDNRAVLFYRKQGATICGDDGIEYTMTIATRPLTESDR